MINPVLFDRLATWNEVCEAISYSSEDGLENVLNYDNAGQLRLECGLETHIILAEEAAWMALASKAVSTRGN